MRYCVIGIHSDRVAMEIHELSGQAGAHPILLYEESLALPLESCFCGQTLNREGEELLLDAMEQLLSYGQKLICEEIFCFASSVLRYAANREALQEKIYSRLGVCVKILSGREQCEGAFRETLSLCGRASGLGCRIGGGSTQIFLFSAGKIEQSASLPIGHGRLYHQRVASVLPSRTEEETIRADTAEALFGCDFLKNRAQRTLYFSGDCCQKAAKLALSITGNLESQQYPSIRPEEFQLIYSLLRNPRLNGISLLSRLFPDSLTTLFPTLLMMDTIGKLCGAEEEVVLKSSLESDYFRQNGIPLSLAF